MEIAFLNSAKALLVLPGVIASLFIYFFFLARGVTPAATEYPDLSFHDVLIPVASPLLSNLSVQQVITKAVNENLHYYILSLCIVTVFLLMIFRSIIRSKDLSKEYKTFFFYLIWRRGGFFYFNLFHQHTG